MRGKLKRQAVFKLDSMDHPRGCGENLFCHSLISSAYRITPADAGKTQPAFTAEDFGRDHPRGCGENDLVSVAVSVPVGSPPRMRGKLRGSLYRFLYSGITPADAGKTTGLQRRGF